jgi:hypothetical protein
MINGAYVMDAGAFPTASSFWVRRAKQWWPVRLKGHCQILQKGWLCAIAIAGQKLVARGFECMQGECLCGKRSILLS